MKKFVLLILLPLSTFSQSVKHRFYVPKYRADLVLLDNNRFKVGFLSCTEAAIGQGNYIQNDDKITLNYDQDTSQYYNFIYQKTDCKSDTLKIEFLVMDSLNRHVTGYLTEECIFCNVKVLNKSDTLFNGYTGINGNFSISSTGKQNELTILLYENSKERLRANMNIDFCGRVIIYAPFTFTKFIRKSTPDHFRITQKDGREILLENN
jgi:hypothetical protein